MKISRRAWAQLALAGAAAAQQPESEDLDLAARRQVERNSEALLKYEVPTAAEPAFLFKA